MNKSKYLREYFVEHDIPGVLAALLKCMNAEEIIRSLDLDFNQSAFIRDKIVERIENDALIYREQTFEKLLEELMKAVKELPFPARNSAGACVSRLFKFMSQDQQDKVLKIFLVSPYVSLRNRAYNLLAENWDNAFGELVHNAWLEHRDRNAIKIMTQFSRVDLLVENFADFASEILYPPSRHAISSCRRNTSRHLRYFG